MATYTVRHNFNRSQPKWGGDYERIFGPRNEGFSLTADTLNDALAAIEAGDAIRHDGEPLRRGLNPFYLLVDAR